MIENIQKGEIVFCDLHFREKYGKITISHGQILGREYDSDVKTVYSASNFDDVKFLAKHGIKQDATLVKVDVKKSLGFKIKNSNFHGTELEPKPITTISPVNDDNKAKPRRKPSKPRAKKSSK